MRSVKGASRLTIRRLSRGLTQQALAEKVGISPQILCGVERRKLPARPERQRVLVEVLGGRERTFFDAEGFAL